MKKRISALFLSLAVMLSLVTVPAGAVGSPAVSRNRNAQDYATWSKPVSSYLFENGDGGLTRVEHIGGQIVVEDYSSGFQFQSGRTIPMELPLWGGSFAGEDYNFLVFGQENPSESDSVEVIRVVKYSKDWQRLGQASLYGANTTVPFDAGSLRMDEYGGYLYLRTCHTMYTYTDGLNHQANLMMAVDQSSMEVTDAFYDIWNTDYGYVSHSFNQFILVDEAGRIVTLDHGDANPRAMTFMRYYADAGSGTFSGQTYDRWCSVGEQRTFAGPSGQNTTGASVGGLAETSACYMMAYNYDGAGGTGPRSVYLQAMDIATGRGKDYQITQSGGSTTPVLAPTGLDGGYLLWNEKEGYAVSDTLCYVHYSASGVPDQIVRTTGALSDCAPISYDGQVVWYVTDGSAPTFYTLDEGGVTAHPTSASAQEPEGPQESEQPEEPAQPQPTPTPEPAPSQPAQGVEAMLAAPTFASEAAMKEDGSLWMWGYSAFDRGVYNQGTGLRNQSYQDAPVQLDSGYIAVGNDWGVKEDHSLWMWGWEETITGNAGSSEVIAQPVKVMDDVSYASTDVQCTLVLKTDGTLWGWGDRNILVGDSDAYGGVPSSDPIKLLDDVVQAKSTGWGWMALKEDGSLWACGISNQSNLNAQAYTGGNQMIPLTHVMDDVAAFSVSWQNTLVIKTDGSLWSWGDSTYGQIGNGGGYTHEQGAYHWQSTPVKIMDDVVYAQAGYTAYAITSDGTLYGWGNNESGQLGFSGGNHTSIGDLYGGRPCQSTPVRITDDALAVAGSTSTVVLKRDGSLWAYVPNYLGRGGQVGAPTKLLDGVALPTRPQPDPARPAEPEQPETPEQPQEAQQPTQPEEPTQPQEPEASQETAFSDVPESAWYAPYANTAASAGLMQGTGDGRFSPMQALSVAEVVTLAARLHAEESGERVPASSSGEPWYQGAYDYCVDSGLFAAGEVPVSAMTGPATRFQMVDLLDRAVPEDQKAPIHSEVTVPDLAQSSPYGEVVYRWYRAGITQGDQNGDFHGGSQITRSETAAILCRLAGLTERT